MIPEILGALPPWIKVTVLIFSGGAINRLYHTYLTNNTTIREELWERLNTLEREVNKQRSDYNRMYAHVIYLEGLLVRKGIQFMSFAEREKQESESKKIKENE